MKFGLFNKSIIICLMIFLWSCSNSNSPGEGKTTSELPTKKDSAGIKSALLQRKDSLKVLLDNVLVQLDSLTGVKNSSPARVTELDKKLDSLKEEANALLVQLESIVD